MKGKEYSLDGLEPVDVYSQDATVMIDGESQDHHDTTSFEPHVFVGTDATDTIMVTTKEGVDGLKEISTIDVIGDDGDDVHLASILPGVMTIIRNEDLDVDDNIEFDSVLREKNSPAGGQTHLLPEGMSHCLIKP